MLMLIDAGITAALKGTKYRRGRMDDRGNKRHCGKTEQIRRQYGEILGVCSKRILNPLQSQVMFPDVYD